jgi:hypothetical protein
MKDILIAVLSLIGVALGWGFTQYSSHLASTQSDKKVLKETLYFLLNIYHYASAVSVMEGIGDTFITSLKSSIPDIEFKSKEEDEILYGIRKALIEYNYPMIKNELEGLTLKYENCILRLSSVDPVNAFILQGKTNIISDISDWSDYLDKKATDSDSKEIVRIITPQIKSLSIAEFQSDLKEIIIGIMRKIGGIQKNVYELNMWSDNNVKDQLSQWMDNYVQNIVIPAILEIHKNK